MKRWEPLKRTKRVNPVSPKRKQGRSASQAVYDLVNYRSGGRCEVQLNHDGFLIRCGMAATDHHHTRKPRMSYHSVDYVVHLCRPCHEACDNPYSKGRLVIEPLGNQGFSFRVLHENPKRLT